MRRDNNNNNYNNDEERGREQRRQRDDDVSAAETEARGVEERGGGDRAEGEGRREVEAGVFIETDDGERNRVDGRREDGGELTERVQVRARDARSRAGGCLRGGGEGGGDERG